MHRPFSTLLCTVPVAVAVAIALAAVPAAAADETETPEPLASGIRLDQLASDFATSVARPVRTVGLHVRSYHSKVYARSYTDGRKRMKFNNQTLGLYLINEDNWALGVYHNSVRRTTVYGGRFVDIWGPLNVALGVATGYNKTVVPMIVPNVHVGPVRLWVQPAIGGPNNTTMVHLSLELNL